MKSGYYTYPVAVMPSEWRPTAELLTAHAEGARDFSGWSMSGGVLIHEVFEGCSFDNARFRECTGAFSSFVNCSFESAEFSQCVFHGMDFQSSSLNGSTFSKCVLERTDFFMSRLRDASISDCLLRGSCFLRTDLSNCRMNGTNLRGSLFGRTAITANMLLGRPDFDDCVVALPHVMSESELTHLQQKIYVLSVLADREPAKLQRNILLAGFADLEPAADGSGPSSADIPVDPAEAKYLRALVPGIVDFLQRGGVRSDYLVPLENVGELSRARPTGSIFLSYATEDQGFAEGLAQVLGRAGFDVWFAPRSMRGGQRLYDQLMREIDGRDRVVLVVSQASMASNWVRMELRRAAPGRVPGTRRIVPVLFVTDDEWRAWTLPDPDSGRDLAFELRSGPTYSLVDWHEREDKGRATVQALLADLAQSAASSV